MMLHDRKQFNVNGWPRIKGMAAAACFSAVTAMPLSWAQEDLVLEEVVVTAQKREESVQDIPATVNAVGGESLDDFKIFNFRDVADLTPGLSLDTFDSRRVAISLRGVSFDPDANSDPAVDTYWNGIITRSTDVFNQMFDIDRIEVLRGPQGTLQGKTSPGGALQIHTRRPSFDQFEGTVETTLSDNGGFNGRAALSIPVADSFAIRVAGVYDESDLQGIENRTTGLETTGHTSAGRLTLDWQPTDTFGALLVSEYLEADIDAAEAVEGDGVSGFIDKYDRIALSNFDSFTITRNQLTSLTINWEVLGHELTSISGYRDTLTNDFRDENVSGTLLPGGEPRNVNTTFDVFVQEMRLASLDPEFWEYLVGLYYEKQDAQTDFSLPVAFLDIPTDREQFGVFTHNRFHITDSTTVQLGLRWTKARRLAKADVFVGGTLVLSQVPPENQRDSGEEITGSLKISHNFGDNWMLYAGYDRGFRQPGVSITSTPIQSDLLIYDGETSDAVELGFKSTLWDGRLQFNGAFYYQQFEGFINRGARLRTDLDNDGVAETEMTGGITHNGDSIIRGGELDFNALLTEYWTMGGGLSYNDAKYDGAEVPCNVPGPDGGPDFVIPGGPAGSGAVAFCDVDGQRTGSEPNVSFSLNSEYTIPLGANELYVRGLFKYNGGRAFENVDGGSDLPGYSVTNLYAGFRESSGLWEVSVWARNLFDKKAQTILENVLDDGSGYRRARIIPERTVGITAKYNFGL